LGFSIEQHRSEWAAELTPYFRFRWCDQLVRSLNCLATPDPTPFLERLAADLAEEEQWSARIKPMDMGSPLLLPECSFSVRGGHKQLWRHARSYGDQANIEGAARAVREFERVYLRKEEHYQWIDDRDLIFGRNGPRHAGAPNEFCLKLALVGQNPRSARVLQDPLFVLRKPGGIGVKPPALQ
jgi:hypothetical protein